MAKVLLMVPHAHYMSRVPRFPDVGLGWLATAATRSGHEVVMRSWNMDRSVDAFKKLLQESDFDMVGIKVFTKDVAAANKTVKTIRETTPDVAIAVGGPHPSTSELGDIFLDFPGIDFAMRGEGERGLPLLLDHVSEKGKLSREGIEKIPGLVWRDGDLVGSNETYFTPDVDTVGLPMWSLMDPKDYKGPRLPGGPEGGTTAPLIVSRGCPSSCIYCAAYKVNGKKVRSRSAGSVLEELDLLYNEYNARHLFFLDTRFTHNIETVAEICEGMLERGMETAWDCVGYENMDTLTEDVLKLMKRAGCSLISMGIEAGNDRIRRVTQKQGTTADIRRKVELVKKVGIDVQAFFMFGYPTETRSDIEEGLNFAFSLPADMLQFEIPCPHPGTELMATLKEKYGVKRLDWETFDVYKSPYPLSELSSRELYGMLKKARRRVLFSSLKKKFLPF